MAIKLTELDFFQIKTNLKDHMKSLQGAGKFTDYDFDGSGMAVLIDLLAYNTHYNALNANMAINEVFLDSAESRNNVVSHAKMLGYVPRSKTAAFAKVDITVLSPIGNPSSLILNRGTQFSTIINEKQYIFTTLDATSIAPDNGVYKFENITLSQGILKSFEYQVDSFDSNQYFKIPDLNVDRDTIVVKVKDNLPAISYDTYILAKRFTSINTNSKAYYLQEGLDGNYEIYFGDGITSKKLIGGNVVTIEWLSTDGVSAIGASVFNLIDTISGNVNVAIATINKSAGGADRETKESIKFNAPLTYIAQNRVVTPDDYKSAILENYSNVESISVWGGEHNDPPQYGKAYISIKPKNGEFLDDIEKQKIKDQILKPRNIVSITPEIIDPEYTYLNLEVVFKYNPALTDLTAGELRQLVIKVISDYNDSDLKQFDGVFRQSKLSRLIDTCNPSILNTTCRVFMKKRFNPILNSARRYQINFAGPLYSTRSNEKILKSTAFVFNGVTSYLQDKPQILGESDIHSDVGGTHTLELYKILNNTKIVTVTDIGYLIATTGTVVLNAFNISAYDGEGIELVVMPDSNDVAPNKNQLLQIEMNNVSVTPEIDTIATGGTPAGVDYKTIPRHLGS